jgi:DNA helicase-2/ATP-dependent DNA helicase PcrA
MNFNEDIFPQRYEQLNKRQREAVDTVYGAVMVIAGPGTGKTEVLSMRIANLLRSEAQVQPHEILCLTYTDEATNSMRRRLVQVIGPAAHKVNIFTFHAFCNNVIQNNSEYFSKRSLQPITDLERTELQYKMVDDLPQGHPLRKLSGNIYFDVSKLNRLFDMMKKEHLTPDYISSAIDEYIKSLPERDGYTYKVNRDGNKKGDLRKDKVDEEVNRMEQTRAAAYLFNDYMSLMKEKGFYDFSDMILWVLDAFAAHPTLLQSYQERYQFILVDEFQDTNGSQNDLLNMLASYWDDPNVFVVGDDDQGIYEFQGARIRNIVDFYNRYKNNISVIVLPENYRSSQAILDSAMATIKYNKQRLITELHGLQLDKDIVSSAGRFKDGLDTIKPVVIEYTNVLQEEAGIVQQIEELQREGRPLNDIAVLYAQHKQADNIIAQLERKGIPYNVKKPVNILELPLIEQLLNVLRYLSLERKKAFEGESALFELMHAPYFGISPVDIAQLSLYMQSKKETVPQRWRLLLSNGLLMESLGLPTAAALHRLGRNLDIWISQQLALPLPLLLEKIVHEGGVVAHLLRTTNHVWDMQVLHTFFEFVKDTHARNVKITPGELLQMVERMNDERIPIPLQRVVQNDHGVHFYTAHSSKGNEFEHVFLIGCTKNFWEEKRGITNDYKLPDTITATEEGPEKTYKVEVARRLFYVALTRAKKHLHISYAAADNAGKSLSNSCFIDEVSAPEERIRQAVQPDALVGHMGLALQPVPAERIKMANAAWIERILQQFTMSYSSLSKYLHCPLTFYYETILRVPFQKNDALAFGSAVHYAIEWLYKDMKANGGVVPTKEQLLSAFSFGMYIESSSFTPAQQGRRMEQGNTLLSDYYDHNADKLHKDVEIEFKIPRYILDGVPVTGKIDKIELHGDTCKVVDYKTGDPEKSASKNTARPNEKEPLGGDYWRQMVFYKLLMENYADRNWKVSLGTFEYVQKTKKGEYKNVVVPVFEEDEAIVRKQLKDAYSSIMNHEFDKGCGKEECHWCNFARRYELVQADEMVEIDDI